MTLSNDLKAAYRKNRDYGRKANQAIERARAALASGEKFYNSGSLEKPYAAVFWDKDKRGLGHVDNPSKAGLREVGRVVGDCGGRNGIWDKRGNSGWYTDPHNDVFRDGTGLCYGMVYQLPARDGKARFVAGYQFGGTDAGPTIDFGTIYESATVWTETMNGRTYDMMEQDAAELDVAKDAARAADSMAQHAAEDEREYQTAWQAGTQYSDCLEELDTIRKTVLATIRDMKAVCATLRELPESLRGRLRASIESDLEERAAIFRRMAKLADGDSALCFWPGDEKLKSAFNEGAGKAVL